MEPIEARLLGPLLHDPFVHEDGLWLPREHVETLRSLERMGVRQTISWRDITGEAPSRDRLLELARMLPTEPIVVLAGALNTILRNRHIGGADRLLDQRDLARELLDDAAFRQVNQLLKTQRFHFIFHEEQLLLAARLAICCGRRNSDAACDKSLVGEFLLRISDSLVLGPDDDLDEPGLMMSLRRLGLAEFEQPRYLLGRYYDILATRSRSREGAPNSVDLDASFLAATGVTMEQYLAFGLLYCDPFMEIRDALSLRASNFLSALKDIEGRIADVPLLEKCRPLYSGDADWFAANLDQQALPGDLAYSRYLAFQERPLYRLSTGSAVPVAWRFLLERATYGAYWILHKYWRGKDPVRGVQRFQAHVGASFQDYATDMLLRCGGNSVVYSEQQIRKCVGNSQGLPDAIIVDGDALIVLEMSATMIPAEVKAAADVRAFRTKATEFGRKFTQIDRVIQRLVRGDLSLPTLDLSRIRRIYPVLVLLFPFPQLPFTWDVIGRDAGTPGTGVFASGGSMYAHLMPRQILTAEELEMIEPIVLGGARLSILLEEKLSDALSADLSFKTWLFDSPEFVDQQNQYMRGLLDRVAARVRSATSDLFL